MTNTLAALRTRHADIQSIVNFTLLLLTLMGALYFGLTAQEQIEIARAV
jgi:hypothetical protein